MAVATTTTRYGGPRPTCGFSVNHDRKTWQSNLCGRPAIVVINMRENGTLHLCSIHWTNERRALCASEGYLWHNL